VTLKAGESRQVFFGYDSYSSLNVRNPVLWWPWQMGEPNMNKLHLNFTIGTVVSDSLVVNFGIREVSSELDKNGVCFIVSTKFFSIDCTQ
jgi:exo-1,4-beta-D-glucosaminidase